MVRFIDREYELSLLNDAWNQEGAKFMVLYGRRRVGKTRLITEFTMDKDGIFFIAEDVNSKVQINELKNRLAGYLNDEFLRKTDIVEWRNLFEYLIRAIPKEKRFYFIIDEFSYLIKNDPAITSALQKFWDMFLSSTQVYFLVSGSIFGLISEKVLSSASPLYGRRTRDILIRPMPSWYAVKFLNMPFEDKLTVCMAIGGVPEYLQKAGSFTSAESFIEAEFLKKDGYFYREPYFLLSQEFKEIRTYFSILNAIAFGNTKPIEIANFAGMNSREIYPYLENLIRLGFVERISPMPGDKKQGIYLINDMVIDFWFNFVYSNREKIERDEIGIKLEDFTAYFGKRFEILVRNELFQRLLGYEKSGKWWYKDTDIDIVAINEKNSEIVFAECKWSNKVNAKEIYIELKEKARSVRWKNDMRREKYAIFAKSFAKKIIDKDLLLFDLKDIEKMIF
ncbi:MAG: ATP-binding protein [Candidatus Methanoperedens sp.]|nr:ATP-binding protein [Candidatus Methanoperedens sp.]